MKFFIVAIMTLIHADGGRDFFVFDKTFDTYDILNAFEKML